MKEKRFEEFAASVAILNGLLAFLYAFTFIVLARSLPELSNLLSPFFLMVGGLLTTAVMVELHQQLRKVNGGFALWALIIGSLGAAGAMIHGGFDLANAIHVPDSTPAYQANLPNPVDPRGLMTFGLSGVALLVWSWLLSKAGGYSKQLVRTGYLLSALLILLYLARLVLLRPAHPIVVGLAIPTGLIVNPLWYLWLGATWWRSR